MDEILTPPTPVPTPPASPVVSIPKPKNHAVRWIVAGAVILVIGVGMGLAIGKYSPKRIISYEDCLKAKGSRVQESNPPTCVTANGLRFKGPVASPTLTPDLTTNWKTYINNQEKIVFDYPQNWSLAEYDKERVVVGDNRMENVTIFFSIHSPVGLESPTTDKIIEAWFNYHKSSNAQFPDGGKELSKEFINVYGFEATKYILVNSIVSSTQSSDQRTWVFIPNNNRVSLLDYQGTNNKLFDQILSTFKFIGQRRPEDIVCGTIAGNLPEHKCPEGYTCQLESNYPDAAGTCVKN